MFTRPNPTLLEVLQVGGEVRLPDGSKLTDVPGAVPQLHVGTGEDGSGELFPLDEGGLEQALRRLDHVRYEEPHSADLHVWCRPADEALVALYTVSVGRRAVCIRLPRELALRSMGAFLAELAGEEDPGDETEDDRDEEERSVR